MKVKDFMTDSVVVASPNDSVAYIRNLMLKNEFSRVVIVDNNKKPIGIVTKKDIMRALATKRSLWKRRPIDKIAVNRIMSTGLITINPEASIKEAAELMIKNKISSLPVVENDELVGIITTTDLLRAFAENFKNKFKVGDIMEKEVPTVNRYHTVNHIVEVIEESGIDRVVVVEDSKPIGIITPSDLSFIYLHDEDTGVRIKEIMFVRKESSASRKRYRHVKLLPVVAEDLMSENLITTNKDEDAANAAETMLKNKISSLPVVENDELVGIITKTTITKTLAEVR